MSVWLGPEQSDRMVCTDEFTDLCRPQQQITFSDDPVKDCICLLKINVPILFSPTQLECEIVAGKTVYSFIGTL